MGKKKTFRINIPILFILRELFTQNTRLDSTYKFTDLISYYYITHHDSIVYNILFYCVYCPPARIGKS